MYYIKIAKNVYSKQLLIRLKTSHKAPLIVYLSYISFPPSTKYNSTISSIEKLKYASYFFFMCCLQIFRFFLINYICPSCHHCVSSGCAMRVLCFNRMQTEIIFFHLLDKGRDIDYSYLAEGRSVSVCHRLCVCENRERPKEMKEREKNKLFIMQPRLYN